MSASPRYLILPIDGRLSDDHMNSFRLHPNPLPELVRRELNEDMTSPSANKRKETARRERKQAKMILQNQILPEESFKAQITEYHAQNPGQQVIQNSGQNLISESEEQVGSRSMSPAMMERAETPTDEGVKRRKKVSKNKKSRK